MRLSSESLFHFTPKEEYLLNILEKGFIPRYCLEDFSHLMPALAKEAPVERAIPMSCFCDIRLSQTNDHASVYGKYIIGLTKEWGIKKGM